MVFDVMTFDVRLQLGELHHRRKRAEYDCHAYVTRSGFLTSRQVASLAGRSSFAQLFSQLRRRRCCRAIRLA